MSFNNDDWTAYHNNHTVYLTPFSETSLTHYTNLEANFLLVVIINHHLFSPLPLAQFQFFLSLQDIN